jgi:hypothetical protein
MTLATAQAPGPAESEARAPVHQLYVTHCLYDEGLSREAGFGVRAGSTRDPVLLRFAREYPAYERPPGLPAAPRLALVRVPGGRSALVRSVGCARRDQGRANNFFSHVLFADSASAAAALAAWGASDWADGCAADLQKQLAPVAEFPRGEAINDRTLTAFLQAPAAPADPNPATQTCPRRLTGDRDRRRRLMLLTLRGCLLVLQAGPVAPRGRLYLLAEPGLVALLLYGAARLLPRGLARGLTFSTYEDPLTLRAYRHAQVVGTWPAEPARGLADEFFTQRGYALDTFTDRCSDELARETDAALGEWIELAARGEWATIDRLHGLLGATTSVVAYKDGVRAARLARRVASGEAGADDLLALKQSPWGRAILASHAEETWPLIREACLADPRLCEPFADVIRANLPDLEGRAAVALRAQPAGNWQPCWRVLWAVLHDRPGELRDAFERLLPEPPLAGALCFALLAELQPLSVSATDPRLPLHTLLKGFGEQELDQFARSTLPREWFVWALCYALLRRETRDAAARQLHEGGAELARVFWQQFRLLRDEAQRRAILSALVRTAGEARPVLLAGLLATGCGLPPGTLLWLLDALGAWGPEWSEFWARDDHLGQLLERVREFGEEGGPVWDRLCGAIDRGVLPPADPRQHTLLLNLVAVRGRPGRQLPRQADEAIADWALLRDHFEKAAAVPPGARAALIDACNRRRLDPITELSAYFERFVEPQELREELLADFAGFFHSFFPEPAEYPDHETGLVGWLKVVSVCEDLARKERYQRYYFDRCVPVEFRRRLAEETYRAGKILLAVYEGVEKAPPKGDGGPSDSAAAAAGMLHQLAGVRLGGEEPTLRLLGYWRRLPWLAVALLGGIMATLAFNLYQPPAARAALPAFVPFLPLVLALADGIALQSAGLAAVRPGRRTPAASSLLRAALSDCLGAALVGVVCGLAVAGVVLAWGLPARQAPALGSAVLAAATTAGLLAPLAAALLGRGGLAVGPPVRAAAGPVAVIAYLLLARALGV